MGACASCLGFGRRDQDTENPETSGLLSDDPYRNHYGSNAQNAQRPVYQPDPESLRREREALEEICHAMSDEVVDIFTTLPQMPEDATRKRSTSPSPQRNEELDPEIQSMAMTYMTVRRGRVGQISSALNKDERGWKAAKAVMG